MLCYDVQDLRFGYPNRFRLEIENFQIDLREKIAVVGGNGSGKSTLLRILAFLEMPFSWKRIRFTGRTRFIRFKSQIYPLAAKK